jgi:hypothetical protein
MLCEAVKAGCSTSDQCAPRAGRCHFLWPALTSLSRNDCPGVQACIADDPEVQPNERGGHATGHGGISVSSHSGYHWLDVDQVPELP